MMQILSAAPTEPWRDPKRLWWLLSPALPALTLLCLLAVAHHSPSVLLWLPLFLIYGAIPLLDAVLGEDTANPPPEAVAPLQADLWYRFVVAAYVPLQYTVTLLGAWIAASQPLEPLAWLGLVLAVGSINGVGINTAHELGHKAPAWERWLARIALAPVAYGHFFVEHNRGHHLRVATPEDPASARMGESLWRFLPRTLIGGLRSAWSLEAARMRGRGLPVLHPKNHNLQAWAMTVLLFGALTALLGWKVLPFLLLQALYGISLLEVVNYIEHYGLLRRRDTCGKVEPCTPRHSWNSNHRASNLFLYHLQRHSDHHAHPARRYQALRHFDESPQLPTGYAGMILLAYCPPLWYRVMDPRVVAHCEGDLNRANIAPGRRDALLARWSTP
ncbi:MAG TPA: alkane 1-monooxygenase [Hydrogenophaga sp.]|mgnify:CR=1 FL=1|uniref:alkane 1-monooxygenase n=1 Tax=Hydrogenophaga sp. TaxID=1904254 RepID=UPI002C5BDEA0|nr:alkane 1-monooxygenase [Hydrogenophaga sp.]HMN93612.1 alkane 1-monooxygenase [Hydrogenophaga sp.]HMP09548.1 alkane 1-monooxygenase [Hydrogenophaga sp.]